MDCRTGDIHEFEELDELFKKDPKAKEYIKPIHTKLTPYQRKTKKIGRNDPCGCGSGKKFKKCCLIPGVSDE